MRVPLRKFLAFMRRSEHFDRKGIVESWVFFFLAVAQLWYHNRNITRLHIYDMYIVHLIHCDVQKFMNIFDTWNYIWLSKILLTSRLTRMGGGPRRRIRVKRRNTLKAAAHWTVASVSCKPLTRWRNWLDAPFLTWGQFLTKKHVEVQVFPWSQLVIPSGSSELWSLELATAGGWRTAVGSSTAGLEDGQVPWASQHTHQLSHSRGQDSIELFLIWFLPSCFFSSSCHDH